MHTKGPWEARNGEVTTQQIDGRSYRRIAAVQDYGLGSLPEVDEANARLIAAAPDLLAALRDAMGWFDCSAIQHLMTKQGFQADWCRIVNASRAAIKKAEATQ
jgi:hypothetical protein